MLRAFPNMTFFSNIITHFHWIFENLQFFRILYNEELLNVSATWPRYTDVPVCQNPIAWFPVMGTRTGGNKEYSVREMHCSRKLVHWDRSIDPAVWQSCLKYDWPWRDRQVVIWYSVCGITAHDFCHMLQSLAFIDLSDKVITRTRKQMKQIRHVTSS
jgi:hypothetical protein